MSATKPIPDYHSPAELPVPSTIRRAKPHTAGAVSLPEDLLKRLRPHAARRDLRCTSLALLLIETVVEHELVDAVLDDAVPR